MSKLFRVSVQLPKKPRQRKHTMHIYAVLATSEKAAKAIIEKMFSDEASRTVYGQVSVVEVHEVEGPWFVRSWLK